MLSKFKLNQLYFKDTQFANLMTRRIFNVLLIANPYDAFMLEDDGRIDEKIFNEYTSLSLRYPPRFSQVSTEEEALRQLESVSFDLVICMPGTGDNDSFDIGRHIKEKYEQIPIVILTPFSHGITKRIANEDLSAFDYVFCWLGNTDLLVSIIKLIEDKMNLEHDVKEVGVFLTGIFPLLFVPAAAGVMELWAEMGEMLLPIIIAIIPVTVLVMVTAGKTTQALTSRKKNKETAANDGIAE